MDVILNLAAPFFGLILVGYALARILPIPEHGLAWLNALVWYLALPSLIFTTIAGAPFEQLINLPFLLSTGLATYLVFIAMVTLSVLLFRSPVDVAGLQGSAASYGNIGYMGLPLSVAALGPGAAVPAILIFCADNIIQFVLTPLLATLGKSSSEMPPRELAATIARMIFTHPFILSAIAGGIAAGFSIPVPAPIGTFLGFLTNAAAPCALFALGVTLSRRRLEGFGAELVLVVVLKLIIHPLLVLTVLSFAGVTDPVWVSVAILMASLPTAANVFIMARQYDAYVEGASGSVLVSSAISAITLSALLYLADKELLPVHISELLARFGLG